MPEPVTPPPPPMALPLPPSPPPPPKSSWGCGKTACLVAIVVPVGLLLLAIGLIALLRYMNRSGRHMSAAEFRDYVSNHRADLDALAKLASEETGTGSTHVSRSPPRGMAEARWKQYVDLLERLELPGPVNIQPRLRAFDILTYRVGTAMGRNQAQRLIHDAEKPGQCHIGFNFAEIVDDLDKEENDHAGVEYRSIAMPLGDGWYAYSCWDD